jgi:hypothetical protein
MPRYFFEVEVNGVSERDGEGVLLDDREAARKVANEMVHGMVKSRDTEKDLACACTVLDENGGHVYRHSVIVPAATPELLRAVAERKTRREAARAARLAAQGEKAKSGQGDKGGQPKRRRVRG